MALSDQKRELWLDGRVLPLERADLWTLVNNAPFRRVVLAPEQWRKGHYPVKTEPVLEIRSAEDLAALPRTALAISARADLLAAARARGCKTCLSISIDNAGALERACTEAGEHEYAAVEFDLPTYIPLELLLARLQGAKTILLCKAASLEEILVIHGVLERGSDGVLLRTLDPDELRKAGRHLTDHGDPAPLTLRALSVTEARYAGMGWRACIDTTGLMTREEGMLIGSTSGGGILVCSETHYLPYMNLRPFRVNAGAVHSYAWQPGGGTAYLTELGAGDEVLCVDASGRTRALTVGRVKMEIRPLLLLKGEADGRELNVIVQDDWHIRIMGADGKPRHATEIRPGDEILAHLCQPGRHVGLQVEETIIEQ